MGVFLIDAGVPSSYRKVIDFIRFLGQTAAELTRILITPADLDHVGAAMALKADSGEVIFASKIAVDALVDGL